MVDFGGWDMPVQYSASWRSTTPSAMPSVFSMSATWAKSRFAERKPLNSRFRHTNNVAKLKLGRRITPVSLPARRIRDDILVHKVTDNHFFLCVNASNQEKEFEHILAHNRFDAQVELTSGRYAQIAIQGPRARATLQKMTPVDLAASSIIGYRRRSFGHPGAHRAYRLYRRGRVRIYVPPAEAGRCGTKPFRLERNSHQAVRAGARNTLRLEAKMALYGHEIDASISPLEADLAWIVKFDKAISWAATRCSNRRRMA